MEALKHDPWFGIPPGRGGEYRRPEQVAGVAEEDPSGISSQPNGSRGSSETGPGWSDPRGQLRYTDAD